MPSRLRDDITQYGFLIIPLECLDYEVGYKRLANNYKIRDVRSFKTTPDSKAKVHYKKKEKKIARKYLI